MAATTGVVNGTICVLYLGETAISYSTSCSLSLSGTTIDVTNKDSGYWVQKISGHKNSWTMSVDAFYNMDGAGVTPYELFDPLRDGDLVSLKFTTTNTDDTFFVGNAIVTSLNITAGDSEAATFSAEFEGAGRLLARTT